MDLGRLLEVLSNKSLYEIFRVRTVIDKLLADPGALSRIQAGLKPGQSVRYFDPRTNQEIEAVVAKIDRTQALLRNRHDGKFWKIPFYMINSDQLEIAPPRRMGIDRFNLKVGEEVGFTTRSQETYYGQVQRLNTKTASIKLNSGEEWRVAYSLLFWVQEAQVLKDPFLPKHETIIV